MEAVDYQGIRYLPLAAPLGEKLQADEEVGRGGKLQEVSTYPFKTQRPLLLNILMYKFS